MTNMQALLLILALSVSCVNGVSWRNEEGAAVRKWHLNL